MANYIEQNLGKNEQVVSIAKLSALSIIPFHFIRYFTTQLGFTNKRVIGKTPGLVRSNVLEAPLNKINSVSLKQGFFGKLFGYGTLLIQTSSDRYYFPAISKPAEFKNAIMAQIDKFEEDRLTAQAQQLAQAIK